MGKAQMKRERFLGRLIGCVVCGYLWMVAGGLGGLAQGVATASIADGKPLAFEVVSVKQSAPDSKVRVRTLPDGYSVTNLPLKAILSNAYGIRQDLIFSAPGWTESTAYDIEAKEDAMAVAALQKLSNEDRAVQIGLMLQAVLKDRFHLRVARVDKEMPVYDLVIAKGGFKLKDADPNNPYVGGLKGPDGVPKAGMMLTMQGQMIGQGIPMSRLATNLSYQVGRSVVDKTRLTGNYDFTLKWTPDQSPAGTTADGQADTSEPSLFTALQEQLGVKLESTKGPVETLVIDHVERPSEN
jgi:uncharacterized protein (TIGR03435 family)